MYEEQDRRSAICGMEFGPDQMHGEHTAPLSQGSHTTYDNCQALCTDCSLKKGADR